MDVVMCITREDGDCNILKHILVLFLLQVLQYGGEEEQGELQSCFNHYDFG